MAQRRMVSMRSRIWSAVACGSGGPPQVRRSSLWMTPCGWPVRWLQAPTRPLSSFRNAARAWRLTRGAGGGTSDAGEGTETGVAGGKAGVAEAEADEAEAEGAEAGEAEAEGAEAGEAEGAEADEGVEAEGTERERAVGWTG